MQPQILLLKDGTESAQGKQQVISNINACSAIVDAIRTTLGPRGMDKLIVDSRGKATISNDGATIMKLLDVVHPAAKTLVDIAKSQVGSSLVPWKEFIRLKVVNCCAKRVAHRLTVDVFQDAEVGDGTTSVVILAGEFLKQCKPFVEEGVHPRIIIRAFRKATALSLAKIEEIAIKIDKGKPEEYRQLLEKCAATSMSSKLINQQRDYFSKMVVEAVMMLDPQTLPLNMIGIKKVSGGALEDTQLVSGVAFKKTFSYAGFEMQQKGYSNPKIALLNIELELKAEKDNAEVRLENVEEYQKVVDAEWNILYDKLDRIAASGAKVVLSKLPIGDVATQYFADKGMFCAGRVVEEDLNRTMKSCGGSIQSTVHDLNDETLATCETFEEKQVGGERFNFFYGCPKSQSCTIIVRGGAEQFMEETERSLHDAIMIVRRAMKNDSVVAGGGAIDMELSKYLRNYSRTIAGKEQLIIGAMAKAFEVRLGRRAGGWIVNILSFR